MSNGDTYGVRFAFHRHEPERKLDDKFGALAPLAAEACTALLAPNEANYDSGDESGDETGGEPIDLINHDETDRAFNDTLPEAKRPRLDNPTRAEMCEGHVADVVRHTSLYPPESSAQWAEAQTSVNVAGGIAAGAAGSL